MLELWFLFSFSDDDNRKWFRHQYMALVGWVNSIQKVDKEQRVERRVKRTDAIFVKICASVKFFHRLKSIVINVLWASLKRYTLTKLQFGCFMWKHEKFLRNTIGDQKQSGFQCIYYYIFSGNFQVLSKSHFVDKFYFCQGVKRDVKLCKLAKGERNPTLRE